MNTKKWLVVAFAIVSLSLSLVSGMAQVNIQGFALSGPIRTDASFNTWSTQVVAHMYSAQTAANDLGYRLRAEYITLPPGGTVNSTIWYAVRITSKKQSDMFSLNMLRFGESSSDTSTNNPNGTLANTYDLGSLEGLVYSFRAIGVIWEAGGPRANDTLVTSGPGNVLVNEILFIGMSSPYYAYSLETVNAYMNSKTNFSLTMNCTVANGATILGSAYRTMQLKGVPTVPSLKATVSGNIVSLGVRGEPGRTYNVLSSTSITAPYASWVFDHTANDGDSILMPAVEAGTPKKFFRLALQ